MGQNADCRFCSLSNSNFPDHEVDTPFAETTNYVAIASIGALAEGWSLIAPREHRLSMKSDYTNSQFLPFVDSVIYQLKNHYGPVVAFEHGANKEGSGTSCGTDHAHLHLVPMKNLLGRRVQDAGLEWTLCRPSDISRIVGSNEYLFYIDRLSDVPWSEQIGNVHILEKPISQFFRKVVAAELNMTEQFNYRHHPFTETSKRTRAVLAEIFSASTVTA